jgi:hypothetical protein
MFTNDITLAGDNSSSTVYALRSITDGKSVRGDASAALGSPKTLTVNHSVVSRAGQVTADRHLVRLDRTEVNSEGTSATASCYMVLEAPRSIVTEAQCLDMVTQLKNFILGSGYLDKLLNSEP